MNIGGDRPQLLSLRHVPHFFEGLFSSQFVVY